MPKPKLRVLACEHDEQVERCLARLRHPCMELRLEDLRPLARTQLFAICHQLNADRRELTELAMLDDDDNLRTAIVAGFANTRRANG